MWRHPCILVTILRVDIVNEETSKLACYAVVCLPGVITVISGRIFRGRFLGVIAQPFPSQIVSRPTHPIYKNPPEYPATWGGDEWRAGFKGMQSPWTGFPKGLYTPLVKGGVNAPPAKCPCPKRRRCEGRGFTFSKPFAESSAACRGEVHWNCQKIRDIKNNSEILWGFPFWKYIIKHSESKLVYMVIDFVVYQW